jgi:hypothetical protein
VHPARVVPAQPQGVDGVHRIVPGVGVRLTGLVDQGIDGQELARCGIVVTVN